MAPMNLVLDTNIVIDYLNRRDFQYEQTRLLMVAGKVGEFKLWVSASQVTDLVYILTDGGKPHLMEDALGKLRGIRTFVNVYEVTESQIDAMLSTSWRDPEDALIMEIAISLKANAVISRNQEDFPKGFIPVMDSAQFFSWLRNERGLAYDEVVI